MNWKTSQSHPIEVAEISLSDERKIGISFCPGKTQPYAQSGSWKRDLGADLKVIRSKGFDVVLSLIEDFEFRDLEVEEFQFETIQKFGMEWLWTPIVDQEIPNRANYTVLMEALQRVEAGKSVFIHCKGGLGRAGTIMAWLLTHFGDSANEAIAKVRNVRNGAIENWGQEEWVVKSEGQRFTPNLRLFTLNVHNPKPDSFELDNIIDVIRDSGAEVIVLTECGGKAFLKIEEELRCNGACYAYADYWGNGILTRTLQLKRVDSVKLNQPSDEVRSAIVAEVNISNNPIRLIGTHLEVSDEASRMEQVVILDEKIGLSDSILIGDLNSLRKSDYHGEAMDYLITSRKIANRSPPRWNVMNRLIDHHNMLDTGSFQDFQATTPYATRVDYILLGDTCGMILTRTSYRIINCIESETSDHNAVLVDLELAI